MTTQNQTRAGARRRDKSRNHDMLSQTAADIAAGQPAAMSADRPGAATAAPPAGIASHAAPLYLGIDVAKAELVAATRADGRVLHTRAYANTRAGIAKMLRRATKDAGRREVCACLESTAGYEASAALALFEAGHAVAVVLPVAVKHFMQSAMRRNKTDAADAAGTHEFMERMKPRLWRPRNPAREQLRQLVNARDALVRQQGDAKRRLKSALCRGPAAAIWRANRDFAARQIAAVDARIAALIASDEQLTDEARLLNTIPGVGPVVTAAVLGHIDFAHFCSASQVAAYIGACPSRKQSGPGPGRARLNKQGHDLLRRLLYMAALSATRHNPAIQQCATRWQSPHTKGNGRPLTHKQSNCAAMRKLARQMFGVVKRGQPYQADWAERFARANRQNPPITA